MAQAGEPSRPLNFVLNSGGVITAVSQQYSAALLLLSRAPDRLDTRRLALRHLLFGRDELIGMAVGNLLRNACQYTDAGAIVVRSRAGSIAIEDTGPGMPPAPHLLAFDQVLLPPTLDEKHAGAWVRCSPARWSPSQSQPVARIREL